MIMMMMMNTLDAYFNDKPKLKDKIFNFLPIRRCDKRLLTNYVCMKQM